MAGYVIGKEGRKTRHVYLPSPSIGTSSDLRMSLRHTAGFT